MSAICFDHFNTFFDESGNLILDKKREKEFNNMLNELLRIKTDKQTNYEINDIDRELLELADELKREEALHSVSANDDEFYDFDQSQIDKSLKARYAPYSKQADKLEAEIYSDIHSYEFARSIEFESEILKNSNIKIEYKAIVVKAVVDYFKLEFKVESEVCDFKHIRKTFKDAKICDNLHVDESMKYERKFIITLHDVNDKETLNDVVDLLSRQYNAKREDMTIKAIELSLDFYNVGNRGFLTALHKSMRYAKNDTNFRIYKNQNRFLSIPKLPLQLAQRLANGFNIAVGHRDNADVRYHAYCKTTDNYQHLNDDQQRLRFEVTLARSALDCVDCNIDNIKKIIKHGFDYISFTKLSSNATEDQKKKNRQTVAPFGQERAEYTSKVRHKRVLEENCETHAELNALVKSAIDNLLRKF